ncbi:MAG: sensor histidine kinase [Acidobacteria bacterium]|nr:sensor histidine kinase [Acidobacteriota bacterium]
MKVPRSVVIILLVTLGASLVNMLYGRMDGWQDVAITVAVSLVYSAAIGTLCYAAGERLWKRGRGRSWTVSLLVLAGAVVVGCLAGHAVVVGVGLIRPRSFWLSYWYTLRFSALITVTFGMSAMIYEYYRGKFAWAEEQLRQKELERERAMKLATEARLASLESRIHPHFLFNTLNTISALIHEDPMKADEQLQRLAKLLRFSLDAPETSLVPLERELQVVADYLEIEKTRFADRLRYRIETTAEARECSVPPLAVQTLVENSVKHHVSKRREGGEITVKAERRGDFLTVTVSDDGPGIPVGSALPGHGLDVLRGRLGALFSGAATLEIEGSEVRVKIPAHVDSRVRIG